MNNISPNIEAKRQRKLHNLATHPVYHLKKLVQQYFQGYSLYDDLPEVVRVEENFDALRIPVHHPSRSLSDTYYLDKHHVLRTHTSAHQTALLRQGERQFLVTGDVYRKDTVDRSHYPVFYQVEGVKLTGKANALQDLVQTLSGLVEAILPGRKYRILDDYFPFTDPSIQIEVQDGADWMEILGAGVIHPEILEACGIAEPGWAFGMGLDRLVMLLCDIPDIRYLWSEDPRFTRQYQGGLQTFQPYSKYPAVYKDISFWVQGYRLHQEEAIWNRHFDLCEIIRSLSGDYVEEIAQIDQYEREGRVSLAYRITYRSPDQTLTHDTVNAIQEAVREKVAAELEVELR